MDRPKRMANSITGRNGKIGPVAVTPKTLAKLPHWNTATMAPSAAPKLNSEVSAAVSGITSERNSTIRAMNPRLTTTSKNAGRASASTLEKSDVTAVLPPT